jgi:two-component system cell cycle sensor histidine kinase PleC
MLSLKNTTLIAFAAIVAVPLAVFWVSPRASNLEYSLERAGQRNLAIARAIGVSLGVYHSERVEAFQRAIEAVGAGHGFDDFRSIAWVDAGTGKVFRKSGPEADLLPDVFVPDELAELKSAAVRSLPTLAIRMGSTAVLQLVGTRHGAIVVADIPASRVAAIVHEVAAEIDAEVTVVDRSGQVVASSKPEWQPATDLSALNVVQRALAGEALVATLSAPEAGAPLLASAVPVASAGWSVIVQEPLDRLQASADRGGPALDLAALCILIAALIGSIAAAPVVAPLINVIRAARRMQHGESSVRIAPLGRFAPTELVELSQAFNAMAESVASARKEEAEARDRAERASQSKSTFLRNVTHEVRTPLNAIIGFSEVLLNECRRMNLPHRQISHAEDIRSAGRHILSLINSLLDLAQIEAGQYQLSEAPTAIDEVITRCVRFLGPAAQARNTHIETRIDADLPDVMADERALFQSVLNVTANAIRYGRDGGHIVIAAGRLLQGGVEIAVSDDGPGIPAEYLDKVMEPFVRVASEANQGVEGSGLGLPIVKNLVELHGGTFVLESTVGLGTTARIRLSKSRLMPGSAADAA